MPGPFYFAWVDYGEEFNAAVHAREDENIFDFTVEQSEGDFAMLTMTVRNPRIGLLAAGRKVWAWLSWNPGDGSAVPLFLGRLVGVPDNINQELVTLVFNARPANYVTLKAALAETLKVRPFYDPIWINPNSLTDPDTVLETRSALWSIDRVSHQVDISDVLVGEDGTVEFGPGEVPYDSVGIALGEAPLQSVSVDATVNWTQSSQGSFDFSVNVETYTGSSLISDWPETGASLGSGWTVTASQARDLYAVDDVANVTYSVNWTNTLPVHTTGDALSYRMSNSVPCLRGPALETTLTSRFQTGVVMEGSQTSDPVNIPSQMESTSLYVPLWLVQASMTLQYAASRPRKEHARFALTADLQPIVTLVSDDDTDTLSITMDSQDVSLDVAHEGIPIGDVSRRSYLTTDRGLGSLEYLIALARANLLIRARAVEVTFACTFAKAATLSCRKNARLTDDRLPGGQAVGKIIKYSFGIDGSSGLAIGSVTMGCAIGYGGTVDASAGDPLYVEDGYVAAGYQARAGQIVAFPAGDVAYTVPTDAPADDGLVFPLSKGQVVVTEAIHGSLAEQESVIQAAFVYDRLVANTGDPVGADDQALIAQQTTLTAAEALKNAPIWYELELKPVADMSFETAFDIEVSELQVAKMIDLEAASTP